MSTFGLSPTTAVIAARPPPRALVRVARAETFRCAYSREGLKACSAVNLSPAVLNGLGLQRVSRPWGPELVEEQMKTENTSLRRLSRALNRVLGYVFFNPGRLQRCYNDGRTSPAASCSEQ